MALTGKKVLIIVQNLPVPFDRRVWLEATTLQKNGYNVSVICPQKYNHKLSFEFLEGVNIFRYSLILEANQSPIAFLIEFISCFLFTGFLSIKVLLTKGFDIIHVCNPPETYFALSFIYKHLGKKIIFDHHDLSPEMYLAKQKKSNYTSFYFKLLLWMEKKTFDVSDIVITTNESHKKIANTRGKKSIENIFVVRSGPDISRFNGYKYSPSLKGNKKFMVCYLGEMCEQDGVGQFLFELKKYDADFFKTEVQFVFIGKGPEQPNLVIKSKELGLEGYVSFTGRVSDLDLANYLYTADLCFDTSPYNSWTDKSTMNKIIEYMAFENATVSFELCETRYTAEGSAIYVQRENYGQFFVEIEKLLLNDIKRQNMAKKAKERFVKKLQWNNSTPNLLAAYDRVSKK